MRVVLDIDVMVAAIRSDAGASRWVLLAALRRRCTLPLSVPLAFEYQAVMTRPEHLFAAHLSVAAVGRLLDAVVLVAEPVAVHFQWRPMLRDPDDEMVLETAVNGRADRLVTFNRRDFAAAAKLFGLTVSRPGDVVLELENDR